MPDASLIYNKQYLCINGNNRDNAHITGSPLQRHGEADPYRSLGHPLRAAVLLHRTRVADGDGPELRPLHDRPAVVHAGVLCQLFRADRPFPVRQASLEVLAMQCRTDRCLDGGRPSDVRTAPASRMGTSEAGKGMAGDGRFLHGERHAVYAGGRAKRRHQDDRELVSDGVVPPGVGEKPCRSRIAESEEPVEPPFSLQHTKQHLQSDRFQPGKSARSRARPKPPAPLRALRQQPTDGSVREGTRLYPELCGTDAYTPAGTCETDHRHIGCHTRNSGGASPFHLPDRECFQAWGKPQQTFFYRPEDSPGRDTDRLLYPQQPLPERQRTGQERLRHWAAESQQAVGIAVSVASYFHVRAKRGRICLPVRVADIRIYCIFVRYINTTNYDVNMCNHR